MARIYEGNSSGEGLKVGIVVSRFNEYITKAMLEGAVNELRRAGVQDTDIHVMWVPGAYEIPVACQALVEEKRPDTLITLGCIIRGETIHYEQIGQTTSDRVQRIALENKIPVGFGVITVENLQQAIDRSGGKVGNKGRDAARAAIEMTRLIQDIKEGIEREETLQGLIQEEFQNK
ncbi:MAG: 6,7-dimethyl-8-ribityllumazine synthase [Omnitrophica bacterium RIFCSPLOWO2_02_FULL_44_11]|nr:MAG: 6,7-dimethyl-8-ribityllumazine synthase [Omnitrophica bacterium RIFCSPLOWO2_02_FULL_44_11]